VADPLIRPHASYLSLGADAAERCAVYRTLIEQAITPEELDGIRLHLQRQHAYGTEYFRAAIEAQLSRRAGPAKIGRPRKSPSSSESAH
jgi:putative transposase